MTLYTEEEKKRKVTVDYVEYVSLWWLYRKVKSLRDLPEEIKSEVAALNEYYTNFDLVGI